MERDRKAELISAVLAKLDHMGADELRAVLTAVQDIKSHKSDQ